MMNNGALCIIDIRLRKPGDYVMTYQRMSCTFSMKLALKDKGC